MRRLIFALAPRGVTVTQAQDSIPNLKGTWSKEQDDPRCRHGRLFSHHSHLARPHGEVLHPKRHEPKQIDRRHLPHDGSGETVRLHNKTKC